MNSLRAQFGALRESFTSRTHDGGQLNSLLSSGSPCVHLSHPYLVLAILTTLNFLNFIDRSILFQVQPLIQREFGVSKMQIGLLTTAFMICFMVAAPVIGFAADRYPRRPIIVAGAVLWSVLTLLTATTWNFQTLLIRHAIVGIGEACMVAAPGYVADLFPREKRGRMLAILFMAIPAGTALGYLIGGVIGHLYGWRAPFYIVSGPGLVCALLLLTLREPERGEQPVPAPGDRRPDEREVPLPGLAGAAPALDEGTLAADRRARLRPPLERSAARGMPRAAPAAPGVSPSSGASSCAQRVAVDGRSAFRACSGRTIVYTAARPTSA